MMYSELTATDHAYQRACLWWMRLAQLAYFSLWSWTLVAWILLLRIVW